MFGTKTFSKTFSIKLYEYVEHFLYTYFLEFQITTKLQYSSKTEIYILSEGNGSPLIEEGT